MPTKHSQTSVVLGCFNGEKYLAQQLDSLALQTALPFEVIISDDGSTDATLAIAQEFAKRAPFPVHITANSNNLGFSENFLQAALRASGQFIAFCDQDDIWRPDKLAICEAAFAAHPQTALTVHTARLIDSSGGLIGIFTQSIDQTRSRPPLSYRPWDVFFGFSMVFRRSLLDAVNPQLRCIDYISGAPKLAHDRWILFLANLFGSTHEIVEPLVDYRQHSANLYGAKKTGIRFSPKQVVADAERYLHATEQQCALIDILAKSGGAPLMAFDSSRVAAFMDRCVRQQRARYALYNAGRPLGLMRWLSNLTNGVYRHVVNHSFLSRAAMKDLLYILSQ